MCKALFLVFAAALLTACPGNNVGDQSQNAPSQHSGTSTANPQAVPENSTAMNPVLPPQKDAPGMQPAAAAEQTVEVQLTEYEIGMPDTLPSGKVALSIANAGKENHSFEMHGGSVNAALPEPLARGDRGTLHVVLQPGSYSVDCPVDGHKGKGMSRTITVK